MQRLKISHVQPSKGAENAGVIPGDVIETFNGNAITSNDELSQALHGTSGGTLVVYRDKSLLTLNVTGATWNHDGGFRFQPRRLRPESVFWTQVASFITFVVALFILYRLLVEQKEATIQLQKENIAYLKDQLTDAKSQSPDSLAQSLSTR